MAGADATFNQADINRDGVLSEGEFRNFIRNSIVGTGTSNFSAGNDYNNLGAGGGYGSSSFQSSSYETSTTGGAFGSDLAYNAAGFGGAGYGSSSYRSSVGNIGGDLANINVTGTAGISSTDAASASYSATSQSSNFQQYETDAQGNFKDSNPQVVRRPAQNSPLTYTQNIKVRFLQPPAVPPPGPLIIKEVRPPQPPTPTPLRVRQQAPPIPTPPPLILREKPPPVPATVASQTVVRNLAAVQVPPRSVVIERLPPAPPKPRDIIIERWIPYGAMAERKTIVQRAEAAKVYPQPRNVIIQHEAPQVRVIRQFQRLGVTPENPQEYIQRYGASLLDPQTLVQQARAAGVVEDISPPDASSVIAASTSEFSSSSSTGALGFDVSNAGGFDAGTVVGGDRAGRSSFYESSSYNSSTGGLGRGIDAAFSAADTNSDGFLSQAEFRNAGF